uniref:LRRNT domain-containing protein n=1 Tax=Latimeria chalumnae TaxID=7897 RepID=H2ZSK1_LATCH
RWLSSFTSMLLARTLGNCDNICEPCVPNFPNGMIVSCTNKSLTKLPDLPYNVFELKLSHNEFTVLTTGMFNKTELVAKLEFLALDYNMIIEIQPSAFWGINKLEHLDLSHNYNLKTINSSTFSPLSELSNLSLTHNSIDHIKDFSFQTQENLKRLELNDNHLSSIDVHLLKPMVQLQILKLEGNPWICSCIVKAFYMWIHEFEGNMTGPSCSTP